MTSSKEEKNSSPFLFKAEWHLQKLARWLTLFGYPTKVVPKLTKEEIAQCSSGKCTILTTSRKWEKTFKNLKVNYLLLPNTEDWITQLCMVLRHFGIPLKLNLNHCPHCLAPLKRVSPEEVKDKIPYYSFKCGKNFTLCPSCGKVYWEGAHQKLMAKTLKRVKDRCKELFGE